MVKNLPATRRHRFDLWVRRISWGRKDNPLPYSCLKNLMDRGAWWAAVHGLQGVKHNLRTEQLLTDGNCCSSDSIDYAELLVLEIFPFYL